MAEFLGLVVCLVFFYFLNKEQSSAGKRIDRNKENRQFLAEERIKEIFGKGAISLTECSIFSSADEEIFLGQISQIRDTDGRVHIRYTEWGYEKEKSVYIVGAEGGRIHLFGECDDISRNNVKKIDYHCIKYDDFIVAFSHKGKVTKMIQQE